jgi:peptide/nickel transport system substrate-binding protein
MQTQLSKMPFVPWRGVWRLLAALALFGATIPTAAQAADKPSGELRIAFAFLGAQRMIPWVEVPSGGIKQYQIFIYDYLVGCTDDGQLSPDNGIAQSWEESADKLQWTFKLRPNIHFHDGTALTADDVKFSIDSVLDPKAVGLLGPARAAFKNLSH